MSNQDDTWCGLGDDPFNRRAEADTEHDLTLFYDEHKLKEVLSLDQFRKGAWIARDKSKENFVGLTEAEKNALDREAEPSLWEQTQGMKITMLTTACAAIVQGWQQSSINATTDSWKQEFPYSVQNNGTNGWDEQPYLAGFVNAAPWISASLIGTWLTDPLQEGSLGRRWALFLAAIFCIACVLGSARSTSWQTLLICRLLLGVGIGAKASIAPVLAAEVAQTEFRGRILTLWQIFDALGIFLGFASVWIVDRSWRVVLGTPAIPAIVLLFLVYLCPESPRFLVRKKKYKKAYLSLLRLKETDVQAARDLYDIYIRLQWETVVLEGGSRAQEIDNIISGKHVRRPAFRMFPRRIINLWTIPPIRRACLAACLAMLAQQMCGINAIAFYSNTLFDNSRTRQTTVGQDVNVIHNTTFIGSAGQFINTTITLNETKPFSHNETLNVTAINNSDVDWMNFGFGLANFVFSLPAYNFIDGYGRRNLLLSSLGGMFLTLLPLAVGIYELASDYGDAGFQAMVGTLGVVVFTACYGIGAGPVPFTLSAEVFPLAVREVGMSFCVMINFIGLSLIILLLPKVTQVLQKQEISEHKWRGNAILLFYFMGFNAIAFVLVFFLVPDGTQSESLESMDRIFAKTTKDRIKKLFVRKKETSATSGDGER